MKEQAKNNLYLIIGEDNKLTNFYLNEVLNKIDYVLDDKIDYDMSINTLSDLIDEASMISLFSKVKVIVGENTDITKFSDNEIEYLSKYINNINKDVYIILICGKVDARRNSYKIFKENFSIIDTTKVSSKDDLVSYVRELVKEKKYKMSDMDIEYFLNKVGNDINNIKLELDKLFIYKEDSKVINYEDINLLIIDNIDSIIYEFTNAVLEEDIDKVVSMYDNFKLENTPIDYLIVSLANCFRQALIIKILHNDEMSNLNISKIIGKKEFYVKKMLERLERYTTYDIANFISKLAKIDRDYKSGKSNIDMLQFFLLDMKNH